MNFSELYLCPYAFNCERKFLRNSSCTSDVPHRARTSCDKRCDKNESECMPLDDFGIAKMARISKLSKEEIIAKLVEMRLKNN